MCRVSGKAVAVRGGNALLPYVRLRKLRGPSTDFHPAVGVQSQG